jgi:hypothetical protein
MSENTPARIFQSFQLVVGSVGNTFSTRSFELCVIMPSYTAPSTRCSIDNFTLAPKLPVMFSTISKKLLLLGVKSHGCLKPRAETAIRLA